MIQSFLTFDSADRTLKCKCNLFVPENKNGFRKHFFLFSEKRNCFELNRFGFGEKVFLPEKDFCFLNKIFVLHLWATVNYCGAVCFSILPSL